MGHRIEIHKWLHPIVAYGLDGSIDDHQPWMLGIAMKTLPVGTAYSVWVGVGAVGTVLLGIALLGEPASVARIISLTLIIAGIVGLKLSNP